MKRLMCAVFAGGLLLAVGNVSWAQDTVRLGGPSAQLDMQGGTDTELVRGFHGGGYHGGWHGGYRGYGGYYGGYRGYYGGYRGYYGGYGYGRGYYGGYGYGGYYRPYYGGYYGGYYPYSSVYYQPYYSTPYYSSYYYPCIGQNAATVTLAQANYSAPQYAAPQSYSTQQQNYGPVPYSEAVPSPGGNSTYPYNGGPSSPIPLPAPNPVQPGQKIGDPSNNNRGIVPLDGKLVSLPNETTGGFTPVTAPARTIVTPQTRTPATTTTTPRVVYPAYGEEP